VPFKYNGWLCYGLPAASMRRMAKSRRTLVGVMNLDSAAATVVVVVGVVMQSSDLHIANTRH